MDHSVYTISMGEEAATLSSKLRELAQNVETKVGSIKTKEIYKDLQKMW